MKLFNKSMITTSLVTTFVALTSAAYGVDKDTPEPNPNGITIKIKGKINPDTKALEIESSEIKPKAISTPPIQEETKNTSSSSSTTPQLTLDESVAFFVNQVTQKLPETLTVLNEAATQPQPQQNATIARLIPVGQELLNTPQAQQILPPVLVSNWLSKLGNSSRRGDERSYNQQRYGRHIKDHDLARTAYEQTNKEIILQAAMDYVKGDQVPYNKLMAKAERFPGLKEKLEKELKAASNASSTS